MPFLLTPALMGVDVVGVWGRMFTKANVAVMTGGDRRVAACNGMDLML